MLSVNQMFYGTDEPVWLVDGSSPAPVKYHYLESIYRRPSPPRKIRFNDELRPHSYLHHDSHRELSSVDAPIHIHSRSTKPYNRINPPPASVVVPNVDAPTRVHSRSTMTYSSINPPPAPIVVPRETPISHTPVLPVVKPGMREDAPYTLLLRVPLCCEGCEKRIIRKLRKVDGVMSVSCDIDRQRVTVRGTADTDEVLRVAKKEFKRSSLW